MVGGDHGAGFQGGNAWTATEARVYLRAQEPGTGEPLLPTAPTLHLQAGAGQTQPHLLVNDGGGGRLVEVDPAGRLLVGPADLLRAGGGDAPDLRPVRVQISDDRSGEAAVRWVVAGDDAPTWVAQVRAYREAAAVEGDALGGFAAARLTFQTPDTTGRELGTLTLRQGRIGIGTSAPAPAALLELTSTTQGFLPPRLTTAQRDAIPAPPEGLVVYNATTKRLNFHDGTAWQEVDVPAVGG